MSDGPIPPISPYTLEQPEVPKPAHPSPGIETWTQNVIKGFARMAVDPEYCRSIQRRVS